MDWKSGTVISVLVGGPVSDIAGLASSARLGRQWWDGVTIPSGGPQVPVRQCGPTRMVPVVAGRLR